MHPVDKSSALKGMQARQVHGIFYKNSLLLAKSARFFVTNQCQIMANSSNYWLGMLIYDIL